MPKMMGVKGDKLADESGSISKNEDLEYTRCFERPLDLGAWILRYMLQATLGRKRAKVKARFECQPAIR